MSDSDLGDFEEEVGGLGDVSDGGTGEETAGDFDRMSVEASEPEGMGVVCAGDGIAVGDEPRMTAYITVGNRAGVRVGRYLVVPYPTTRFFSRVSPNCVTHSSSSRTMPTRYRQGAP
jgi:hypothetical protein